MKERLVLLGYALFGGVLAAAMLFALVRNGAFSTQPKPALVPQAATSCAISMTTPACNACLNASCGGACDACASNPACLRLYLCVLDCTDAACRKACEASNPGGKGNLDTFAGARGCMATYCKDACK
jgi:hypothetical protein